jgi:hypothetical protein
MIAQSLRIRRGLSMKNLLFTNVILVVIAFLLVLNLVPKSEGTVHAQNALGPLGPFTVKLIQDPGTMGESADNRSTSELNAAAAKGELVALAPVSGSKVMVVVRYGK